MKFGLVIINFNPQDIVLEIFSAMKKMLKNEKHFMILEYSFDTDK